MAEETTDQSQKTEEPTQKKLDDSRKKGQVATSREVNNWFMILAGTIIVAMISPSMSDIKNVMQKFLAVPHAIPVEAGNLADLLRQMGSEIGFIMVIPILLLLVAAFASKMA